MSSKKLTILFAPLDGHGHINACLGVAQVLQARGHKIIFALDRSFKGRLAPSGIQEEITSIPGSEDSDGEFWPNYIAEYKLSLSGGPLEKMEKFSLPATETMSQTIIAREEQYKEIIARVKPDIIVIDNYFGSPAQTNSGIPWVWLVSASPLVCISDPRTPPGGSGLPTTDNTQWEEFRNKRNTLFAQSWVKFNEWVKSQGAPSLKEGETHPESPWANIYMIPEEMDYLDLRPLPPKWHRFDSLVRQSDDKFEIPEKLKGKSGKLVYVSMGSFASADVILMARLVDILKHSKHRFIFSKGPKGELYELDDNMWGQKSLPQTKVIPIVDLVITHGGNNTVTESFYFGKPMIVMPLFADQFDNAQRVQEKNFGLRMDPYLCTQEELLNAVDKLVNDESLKERMRRVSKRIQNSRSNEKAADLIEKIIVQ